MVNVPVLRKGTLRCPKEVRASTVPTARHGAGGHPRPEHMTRYLRFVVHNWPLKLA